jgi:hypothetical protein
MSCALAGAREIDRREIVDLMSVSRDTWMCRHVRSPKPRLTGIEDIFQTKRTVETTHVALDAV